MADVRLKLEGGPLIQNESVGSVLKGGREGLTNKKSVRFGVGMDPYERS